MANTKFAGMVAYADIVETAPGVHEEQFVERLYYGDIQRTNRRLENSGGVNDDVVMSTAISIVADAFANDHFFAIRYVEWAGAKWKVSTVEPEGVRLLLRLGGVYNGPTL